MGARTATVLGVLLAILAPAGTAHAVNVVAGSVDLVDGRYVYTASSGFANAVTTTYDAGAQRYVFADGAGMVADAEAGDACAVSGSEVQCIASSVSNGLSYFLGDQADSTTFSFGNLTIGTSFLAFPVTIQGGAGDDTL